ncbi:hypothetical protein O181_061974 [Austropuccinia psidii MF-1]|uniref:Uncharacterized protein n=1 Tax=Austropuccinia psidii MF-1 TaxID=1389203 RepID=A0A9Q3EJH5_9BASI|nr:hypothetical protein [Austropuccinia psidii MF-1]
MRAFNLCLKGIGGHSTAVVLLSENALLVLPSGEEGKIHFFVGRGAVHTLIRRPFLADNRIRLEHSQDQGEILGYRESDGKRLCIPICSPEAKGWNSVPPKVMELCNMVKASEWKDADEQNSKIKLREISNYVTSNERKNVKL